MKVYTVSQVMVFCVGASPIIIGTYKNKEEANAVVKQLSLDYYTYVRYHMEEQMVNE